jgi:hypothetical protein
MSMSNVTLAQTIQIIEFAQKFRADIHPGKIAVDDHGNVEFMMYSRDTIYRDLIGFVILDADGKQVANVTPKDNEPNAFVVRRYHGEDFEASEVSSNNPHDDSVILVAQARAREHAAEMAEDQVPEGTVRVLAQIDLTPVNADPFIREDAEVNLTNGIFTTTKGATVTVVGRS